MLSELPRSRIWRPRGGCGKPCGGFRKPVGAPPNCLSIKSLADPGGLLQKTPRLFPQACQSTSNRLGQSFRKRGCGKPAGVSASPSELPRSRIRLTWGGRQCRKKSRLFLQTCRCSTKLPRSKLRLVRKTPRLFPQACRCSAQRFRSRLWLTRGTAEKPVAVSASRCDTELLD